MIVGLTGGIGSGKTAASDRFKELGVSVIDADVISHELSKPGTDAYTEIIDYFGNEVCKSDGEIDRAVLREIVFADPAQRNALENILHPRIRREMIDRAGEQMAPYHIFVIPLLVENRDKHRVDRVLVIDTPDEKRIEWIKTRSGLEEQEIKNIMASQATREQRLRLADDVIENSGTLNELRARVDELHREYLNLATSS